MTHSWSQQQEHAIQAVSDWLRDGEQQTFRLFGYAGTGKTTLAQHLVSEVAGPVLFGAYTGKAALVLQSKGCANAMTIHQMIYLPRERSQERLAQLQADLNAEQDADRRREIAVELAEEKDNLKRPTFTRNLESPVRNAALVVLDEVSMVGHQVADDLLEYGTRILALGDPAQLPPVRDGGYFTDAEPDVMLTEIHRQAEGSPIVRMATAVRNGEKIALGAYGDSRVVKKGEIGIEELAAHDQIIVGRNATRRKINHMIRSTVKGHTSGLPVTGDKLVCLRNNRMKRSTTTASSCGFARLTTVIRTHLMW